MAKILGEKFWLLASILNSTLGLHFMLRALLYRWLPTFPLFAATAFNLFHIQDDFNRSNRHKRYFTIIPKILVCLCLQSIIVFLSEWTFTHMGYIRLVQFACIGQVIPGLYATLWRPCKPQLLSRNVHNWSLVMWAFWTWDHSYLNQFLCGSYLFNQSLEFLRYHLYMEADRTMHNTEYYEWLLQENKSGAIVKTSMLDDLFRARGVDLTDIHRSD